MGGVGGADASRSYCVNANGLINGLSSVTARVEIKEKSGARSRSEPAMTSRMYNLGNIAPGNGAWRGILVKSKRSRFASPTILRGA